MTEPKLAQSAIWSPSLAQPSASPMMLGPCTTWHQANARPRLVPPPRHSYRISLLRQSFPHSRLFIQASKTIASRLAIVIHINHTAIMVGTSITISVYMLALMTGIAVISSSTFVAHAQSVGPTSVPGPNPFVASPPSQPLPASTSVPSTSPPSTNACDCTTSGVSGTTNTTFIGCGQWLVAYDKNEFVCFVMVRRCIVCSRFCMLYLIFIYLQTRI